MFFKRNLFAFAAGATSHVNGFQQLTAFGMYKPRLEAKTHKLHQCETDHKHVTLKL